MPYNLQAEAFMSEHKRKCPVCGKTFWSSAEWVYKRSVGKNLRVYCSWKCMRSEEKDHMTIADKIYRAIDDGLNNAEIRKLLGVTQRQIDYYKERKV